MPPYGTDREDCVESARKPGLRPELSLIVPTRNERENVAALVERVHGAVGDVSHEILFVDDSDDDTPAIIADIRREDRRIRILHRAPNERAGGLSTAVVAGMRTARGKYLAILDGDLQHPPEALPVMYAAAQKADIVVASRYISGGSSAGLDGLYRQGVSRGSKLLAGMLFHRARACSDPMSGYFLVRREVIEGIDLRPVGFKVLLEILVRGRWSRLIEVPYHFEERENGASKAHPHQGIEYLDHLATLRLHGKRSHGPIQVRAMRVPVGPDDPQPLDDDLPDAPEPAGNHRRRLLWVVALLALALRIVLLPVGHWWDLTVDYNVFVDLIRNHSPYDTMVYLSHIARAAHWDTYYEYYAYPPVPLYFYWPLAHIYALIHPNPHYFIPVSGSYAMPSLPIDFYFWLKLPMWIADFIIAGLLARMSGTIRGWRDYLLNPYVLLISAAWTFDAVMVLGLVLGVYWLQQGKFGRSGVALAFGTMVKFIPALAVPTFILFMIKKQRRVREIVLFVAAYAIASVVMLGPFLNGLLYVINFHSGRVGGGMTWQMYWRLSSFFPHGTNLDAISTAIGSFDMPTLAIVLLLAYWYMFVTDMRLNRMVIVTLLAFFVGSKLINEQYALVIFPFAFIEARQVGGAWRWLARLFWIVPLAFAIMRVPIDRFLWLFYHTLFGSRADVIAVTGVTGFESPFVPWKNVMIDQAGILVLGLAFFALSVIAILWPVRPPRVRFQRLWLNRPIQALRPVSSAVETAPEQVTLPGIARVLGDAEAGPEVALRR
jgi:glycosyltransferase involved in cell wall biosynthesis